jgi:plastocyanin
VLNRAGTKGVTGPNLDLAFRQSLADGFNRDTVEGVVAGQIDIPQGGQMPADLVSGKDRKDVAAYVAEVAAEPGKDQGLLAQVGQVESKGTAKAEDGRLELPIPDSGLIFASAKATAEAGRLTIVSENPQSVPHNVALEGGGLDVKGPVVQGGRTSEISASVKKGKYVFYCSVPGHREGGMEGTLTVE